tara:strand:+ start:4163 stop:6025 length:1863 start_codon:yes stop_codon:yes gene_type:complete
VAAERLQIRIDAVDKTRRAFRNITGSLDRLRARVFSLQSAFATIGAGLAVRSFVNVGREVETLENRFKFLFGSVKEGQKAFDALVTFASKVPFTLQEIAGASGNLAVISKDAQQLTKNLEIVGNVSAVTGIDFRTTAEQIQRSFSSGIASAEIFRERGVRALLGFESGASVSVEQTIKAFEEAFGKEGRFANATKVLAATFDGTLSQITDKLFKFQLATNRADFFGFIKAGLATINDLLDTSGSALDKFAQKTGETLVSVTKGLLVGTALIIDAVAPIFSFVAQGFQGLFNLIKILPTGVREIGVLGFLLLGRRGKILALILGSLIEANRQFVDKYAQLNKEADTFGNNLEKSTGFTGKMLEFFKMIEETQRKSKEELDKINKLIEKGAEEAKKQKQIFGEVEISLKKIAEEIVKKANDGFAKINETIATGIVGGIKSISRGLAESIVLGKNLADTFRQLAQQVLINVIARIIETITYRILERTILKDILKTEQQKLSNQNRLNSALKTELALRAVIAAFGGGGGGFGAEGGQVKARADGGSVAGSSPYIVGERGRELFIPNTDGEIVSNERLQRLGTNVNFTINATDVKGVKELLIDNRAVIVNIVNSALNQKGKAALV